MAAPTEGRLAILGLHSQLVKCLLSDASSNAAGSYVE